MNERMQLRDQQRGRRRRPVLRRLAGGLVVAVSIVSTVGSASAQVGGRGSGPVSSQPVQVEGILGAVYADPTDGRSPAYMETLVTSERDRSQSTEITFPAALIDRYGGIDELTSKRVSVTAVAETRGRSRGTLTATAVQVLGDGSKGLPLATPAGSTGSPKPALTALCRFADKPVQPQMQSYFEGLAGASSLMSNYFSNTSYGRINLDGSKVAPARGNWYVLPGNQADYIDEDNKMELRKLYDDCTGLAAQHFNLDDFAVINMAFNTSLVNYAFGGGLDGRRLTWLPPVGWLSGGVTGHEMGHAFKMSHTGLAGEYDNAWDVMSGSGLACTPHPVYKCMPQHQSAYNKNRAGWLEGRIVDVPELTTTTVELQPLDAAGTGPVLARITPTDPVARHAYYVEFRRPVGLDANLPLAGAVGAVNIYEYWETPAPTEEDPDKIAKHIQLMGTDGKAGARWLPGMVFDREKMFTGNNCDQNSCQKSPIEEALDYELDGIRIRVNSITATKASVTFTQLPALQLAAGDTTPSSYTLHWTEPASTASFVKIHYTDNKNDSGDIFVPANSTSFTFNNAPSGVTYTHTIQACNVVACGTGSNVITTGADPKPIKNG